MTSRINNNGNGFNGNGYPGNGNGHHGNDEGSGYHNSEYGDLFAELGQQAEEAQERRLEPASSDDYMVWVAQVLRKSREDYNLLSGEHGTLVKQENVAHVGLDRLNTLIGYKKHMDLEQLQNMQRDFAESNKSIGYSLDRCKAILDETAITNTLIADTMASELADKRKKIGMQKELGLRLRDVDDQFERCKSGVQKQKNRVKQITQGIQKLMSEAGLKLPPKVKENIKREDAVLKLGLQYGKVIKARNAHDTASKVNPNIELPPVRDAIVANVKRIEKSAAKTLGDQAEPKGLDPVLAGTAALVGITVGMALLYGFCK